MSGDTRVAERKAILFGETAPDPEMVRLEAVQRVQSKHHPDGALLLAYTIFSRQEIATSQEPRTAGEPSRSLVRWWSLLRRTEPKPIDPLDSKSTLVLSTCMESVRRLVDEGRTRAARQYLHEVIDDLFKRGHFATVDAILFSADPMRDDPRILITLLTATKAARDRLALRGDFFVRTAESLKQRSVDEPGLLTGLE